MVDRIRFQALNQCVVAYARRAGATSRLDSNRDGKVSTLESVFFYYNHLAVRRACFGRAGLRHPLSLFGHTCDEERSTTSRLRGKMYAVLRSRRFRGNPRKALSWYLSKVRAELPKLNAYVSGNDEYNVKLAALLGLAMRRSWRLTHEGAGAEYTAFEAIRLGKGSCTEYTYIHYQLCRLAGISKSKIMLFEAETDEYGRPFIQRIGGRKKRVWHVCLGIRVSPRMSSRGVYLIDAAQFKFNNPKYGGKAFGFDGFLSTYLDSVGVALDAKGRIRDAYEAKRMATMLAPSMKNYRNLLNTIHNAVVRGSMVASAAELKAISNEMVHRPDLSSLSTRFTRLVRLTKSMRARR